MKKDLLKFDNEAESYSVSRFSFRSIKKKDDEP
jgi:hypothetical protein